MENSLVIELTDGTEVELVETWDCCDGIHDCGSKIEVIDCETNDVIAVLNGTLPDFEDEDFDMDEFIGEIEGRLEL